LESSLLILMVGYETAAVLPFQTSQCAATEQLLVLPRRFHPDGATLLLCLFQILAIFPAGHRQW